MRVAVTLKGVLLAAAVAGSSLAGCIAGEVGEDELTDVVMDEAAANAPDEFRDDTAPGSGEASGRDPLAYGCSDCSNCVLYARCRTAQLPGPNLPYGLTCWSAKKAIAHHSTGRRGCVAMIYRNNGPPGGCDYGHAAFVRSVSGSIYYIDEAGWPGCNSRHGTKSGLGIYGFWCPY